MSQINFELLRRQYPELRAIWNRLEDWISDHPATNLLEPRELARDLYPIPIGEVVKALSILAENGLVAAVFVVTDPNGVIVSDDYLDPREIPSTFPNRTHDHYFSVSDERILPVFRMAEHETAQ